MYMNLRMSRFFLYFCIELSKDKYDKKRTVCIIFVAACAAFDFFVCNDPWCGSVCKKYVGVECDFHFAVCF